MAPPTPHGCGEPPKRGYLLRTPAFRASTGQAGVEREVYSVYDAVGAAERELTALLEALGRRRGVGHLPDPGRHGL